MSGLATPRLKRFSLRLIVLLVSLSSFAYSQSRIILKYKGQDEDLYYVDGRGYYVFVDGKKRKAEWTDNRISEADMFGVGFVEVEVTHVEALKTSSKKVQSAKQILFEYEAKLTADRDLDDCFAVLTYLVNGNPSIHLETIGRLRKGRVKELKIETSDIVSSVGSLHIFSGGKEVRSTGIVPGISIKEEFKSLQRSFKGIPVVELLETEESYPHFISLGGDYIATFRDKISHTVLAIIDIKSREAIYEIETGEYFTEITDLAWVSPDEVLFVMAERKSQKPATRDYHRFDWGLYHYKLGEETFEKIRNNVSMIYSSNLPSLPEIVVLRDFRERAPYRYNFRTKEAERDQNLDYGESAYMGWDGFARVKTEYRGKTKHIYYLEPGTKKWKPLDDFNNETSFRFNHHASGLTESRTEILSVSPDPWKLYLWLANDAGIRELALYNVETGLVEEKLFTSRYFDLGGSDISGEKILTDKTSLEIAGIVTQGQMPTVIWRDERYAQVQATVNAALPNRVNIPIDWSRDLSTFIYRSYSDKSKGQYYLFRPEERKLVKFYDLSPQLEKYELGTTKPFKFPARDGYQLYGYFTFPPEYKPGDKLPLIVNPHGGPQVRDVYGFDSTVQYFASLGYGVLQINYRGSAGYGISHLKQGLEGEIDGVIIDDIVDGTRFMIEKGIADPDRVAILGASFGGYATYMCLIRYPDLFQAGIAVSAVAHWKNAVQKDKRYGLLYAAEVWDEILSRSEDPDYERRISPYYRVSEILDPVLILHGRWDGRVFYEQAEMMERALKKENKVVKLVKFPESGHSIVGTKARTRYLDEIRLFLEEHLAN